MSQTLASSRTALDRPARPGLLRVLGPWSAAAIVVGTMLGTGIFIVPGAMARQAGSVPLVMLAWVAGAVLSLFGALSYAELAAAMPEAGGQYVYLRRAFGPRTGFLFGWTHAVLVGPCSGATIATGLLQFAVFMVPSLAMPLMRSARFAPLSVPAITPAQLWTVGVLIAIGSINYLGVRLGGRIQVALTTMKVAVLVAVVAIPLIVSMPAAVAANSNPASVGSLSGFMAALVAALWAYEGWTNLTYVGSEIANPQRSIPRALCGGVFAVALLYVLVNATIFYVLPLAHAAASPSVVADMVESALGPGVSWWITAAMMVSALGSLNSDTLTNARIPFALARDRLFLPFAARISPTFHTPGGSLLFHTAVACVLALTGTFEDLYSLYVFSLWLFYGLGAAAVIVLRRTDPDLDRPYRTWGYPVVPAAFVLSCAALTFSLWLARPVRSTVGLALILAGLPVYAWTMRRRTMATRPALPDRRPS